MGKTTTAHDEDDFWDPLDGEPPYYPNPLAPNGFDTGGPGFPGWPFDQPHPSWSTSRNRPCFGLFAMGLSVSVQELPTEYFYNAVVTQTMVTTCMTKRVKCKNGPSMVLLMNGSPKSELGKRANQGMNWMLIANGRPYGPKKIWLPWPGFLGPDGEYGGWPSMRGTNGVYQGQFNYAFFLGCCKNDGCADKTKAKSFNANGTIPKRLIGNTLDPVFPPFNDPKERAADIAYLRLLQEFGPDGNQSKPEFESCCR